MLRKVIVLTILIFFVAGTFVAIAGDKTSCCDKNVLQGMYNWFSDLDKSCAKNAECCCKACGKQCCKACNADCGGKCCSNCCKK